jgi:hypothetical protein
MPEEGTAFYKHMRAVYAYLEGNAELSSDNELIFEGKWQDAFEHLGISSSYYSPIRKMLETPADDPCCTIYQRGNSEQPSLIKLHHPPLVEWKNISVSALTKPREGATLISDLEREVAELKAWREEVFGTFNVRDALRNHEGRIARLEDENGKGINGKKQKS